MHVPLPAEGASVWIRRRLWVIERAQRDGDLLRLDVRDRRGRLTILAPFDRPVPADRCHALKRVRRQGFVARLAGLCATRHGWCEPAALVTARADILDYQLEPVSAFLAGARRVLLADAVGLGKTVQAGLVLAELWRRTTSCRALIICPAVLRQQWIDELWRRFALSCLPADRETLAATRRSRPFDSSPWDGPGIWITSSDFLKQPHVCDGIPLAPWDLLVIDEAHEAAGRTDRQAVCEDLAKRSRRVLLLTATPHDGDAGRFGRLIALGALPGDRPPVVFRRTRRDVGLAVSRRVRWHVVRAYPAEATLWRALSDYERAVLSVPDDRRRAAAVLLSTVFRKRALSTAVALRQSLERRLEWLERRRGPCEVDWLQPSLAFDDSDVIGADERTALTIDIGMAGFEERRWLRRLVRLASAAATRESKVERIAALVGRAREPVVIFTEFFDSLQVLVGRLAAGTACIHGGQPPAIRNSEIVRFRQGDAPVFVATDVGGQGLNLQDRSRWVVNLEVPWTPTRLEQRIGRVDRIGQRRPVHATVLVAAGQAESRILVALGRRVLAAQSALGRATLADVAPCREALVARSILLGDELPLDDPAPAAIVSDTTWRRRGRALASVLRARRALSTRWQHDAPDVRIGVLRRQPTWLAAAPRRVTAVFSVSIANGRGDAVERCLVAIEAISANPVDRPVIETLTREAQSHAARALSARCRRVDRLRQPALAAAQSTDEQVERWIRAVSGSGEVQLGLFSLRALHLVDRNRAEARRLAAKAALVTRPGPPADAEASRTASPVLELLLVS